MAVKCRFGGYYIGISVLIKSSQKTSFTHRMKEVFVIVNFSAKRYSQARISFPAVRDLKFAFWR